MKLKLSILNLYLAFFAISTLSAQNAPVTFEAESGVLGSNFNTAVNDGVNAITISTDLINSYNPGSPDRVATYEITFPEAGTYDLYGRINVGAGTFNDDSYFIGNGFGAKDAALDADWVMTNGLAAAGYTLVTSIVDGVGGAGSSVWKWVNFSEFLNNAIPVTFSVADGALTQTFQIGAREDGLSFDKFVFGKSDLYFTVDNLNKGEQGSTEKPTEAEYGTPLAEGQSKYLGCAWDNIQSVNFPSYWNQSTPGNAGKWGSVEGTRDQMNWRDLDSTYNVAKRYNMLFKEHTLFWGAQQPSWMADLSPEEQLEEIIEWLDALATRYPDMDYIDVVNEPIHNAPNGMVPWGTDVPNINYADALGGAGTTGYDWIIEAFRLARQYFPNSKLILNEYSVINDAAATQKIIEIVELLKAENLIDGIGEQAHAFTTKNTATAT
jgi:endo-1,4-beta-xylanase